MKGAKGAAFRSIFSYDANPRNGAKHAAVKESNNTKREPRKTDCVEFKTSPIIPNPSTTRSCRNVDNTLDVPLQSFVITRGDQGTQPRLSPVGSRR